MKTKVDYLKCQIAENAIQIHNLELKNSIKFKVEITLLKDENYRLISKFNFCQNPD